MKIGSDDLRHGQGCGDRHHFLNRLLLQSGCLGNLFGSYLAGAFRNPTAAPKLFGNLLLGFALTEAVALFALVIAFLILFS